MGVGVARLGIIRSRLTVWDSAFRVEGLEFGFGSLGCWGLNSGFRV